jgi:hypothetical protein
MQISHFGVAVLYALFASIVLGICFKTTTREMVRYGFYSFAMFVGGLIAAGWAMWLLRH